MDEDSRPAPRLAELEALRAALSLQERDELLQCLLIAASIGHPATREELAGVDEERLIEEMAEQTSPILAQPLIAVCLPRAATSREPQTPL